MMILQLAVIAVLLAAAIPTYAFAQTGNGGIGQPGGAGGVGQNGGTCTTSPCNTNGQSANGQNGLPANGHNGHWHH